jgi:HlyD family secretion protein
MPDPMLHETSAPADAPVASSVPVPAPVPAPEPVVMTGTVLPRLTPVPHQRSRGWGRWVLGAIGLIIGAALVSVLLPKPVPVDIERVGRGPMQVTVDEDGRTRVRDRYEISAPVAGTLLRVTAREGDSVRAGDVLARIVPLPASLLDARTRIEAEARVRGAEAALQQANTEVARAEAANRFATRDAERQRTLEAAGAIATQAREQAELAARTRSEELSAARSGVRVAQSELALYRASLARLLSPTARNSSVVELRAPTDGVVLTVLRKSEGPVQPGQAVLAIGDPRRLEIVVDLLTPDAALVRPGASARIERWGGAAVLRGHVRRVEPAAYTKVSALGVEEQRVDVVIDLDDPPDRWSSLGEGYRVEASILVWSGADVVTVPASVPFRHGGGWAVYAVAQGRARLTPIEVGHRTDAQVEVPRGLQPGDTVIGYPGDQVREGLRVRERP